MQRATGEQIEKDPSGEDGKAGHAVGLSLSQGPHQALLQLSWVSKFLVQSHSFLSCSLKAMSGSKTICLSDNVLWQ